MIIYMRILVGGNSIGQKVSNPISIILPLGVLAILMWFIGKFMSLNNPELSIRYYGVAVLLIISMVLYFILYFK